MTRGRRKDLTIPPSRALLQQRDYRARKAQYVADLEDRCRRAEEDNEKLRKELDSMRLRMAAGGTMAPSSEVVAASSELMHQLTSAASTLARFQQLAFNEQAQAQAHAQAHALSQAQMQTQNLRPPDSPPSLRAHEVHTLPPPSKSYPKLPPPQLLIQPQRPSPPRQVLHPSRHQAQPEYHHHRHSLTPPTLPPPLPGPSSRHEHPLIHPSQSEPTRTTPSSPSSSRSRGPLSAGDRSVQYVYNEVECCWGYFDCRDLGSDDREDEEDELIDDDRSVASSHKHRNHYQRSNGARNGHGQSVHRTSEMRSTSSSPGLDDAPMRMRDDSPMRTR